MKLYYLFKIKSVHDKCQVYFKLYDIQTLILFDFDVNPSKIIHFNLKYKIRGREVIKCED